MEGKAQHHYILLMLECHVALWTDEPLRAFSLSTQCPHPFINLISSFAYINIHFHTYITSLIKDTLSVPLCFHTLFLSYLKSTLLKI